VAAEAGCWEKHIPLEVVIPEVLTPGRTIRDLYEDNTDSFPHRWPSLSLERMTSKGWQAGMRPAEAGCWEKHIFLEVVIPEVLTPGRTIRDLYEGNTDSFSHTWPTLSLEGMTSLVKGRKKVMEWEVGTEEPAIKGLYTRLLGNFSF
jgi:hypothetical protein